MAPFRPLCPFCVPPSGCVEQRALLLSPWLRTCVARDQYTPIKGEGGEGFTGKFRSLLKVSTILEKQMSATQRGKRCAFA